MLILKELEAGMPVTELSRKHGISDATIYNWRTKFGGDLIPLQHTFTHAIFIDFKDKDALDRFFNDSITHLAKEGIVNIVDGGYNGIIGFELIV